MRLKELLANFSVCLLRQGQVAQALRLFNCSCLIMPNTKVLGLAVHQFSRDLPEGDIF